MSDDASAPALSDGSAGPPLSDGDGGGADGVDSDAEVDGQAFKVPNCLTIGLDTPHPR